MTKTYTKKDQAGVPVGGTTGEVLKKNSGTDFDYDWGTGGGTPAGSDTQIQYNNSGAFGATSSFVWNDTNKSLDISSTSKDTFFTATGNINSFYQANIQNTNSGASASTDWVATANNGSSTTHYIDMGINSSGGGGAPFTTANHTYLYSIDDTLNIGALGASSQIRIFTTGGTSPVQRAVFDENGRLGITTPTPASKIHVLTNSLGTTQSDSSGILLENSTAAANGAQQISPPLTFSARGFASTGSVNTDVRYQMDVLPVQGTSNTYPTFRIRRSNNGGSTYSDAMAIAYPFSSLNNPVIQINGSNAIGLGGGTTQYYGSSSGFSFLDSAGSVTLATMSAAGRWALTPTGLTTAATIDTWSLTQTWNNASGVYTGIKVNVTNTASAATSRLLELQTASTERFGVDTAGKTYQDTTITAAGTTGNQTINKPTGTVNIAAAGTTVTVTNSLCSTSSIVFAVLRTNDTTAYIKNVVPGSGSFVINLGAAATAEVSIGFQVIN